MLFKSREKTLHDRTKKLVKLEEQKRALRDTGQDSRISSVKKKQRALLLKLQQEKDEMNRYVNKITRYSLLFIVSSIKRLRDTYVLKQIEGAP